MLRAIVLLAFAACTTPALHSPSVEPLPLPAPRAAATHKPHLVVPTRPFSSRNGLVTMHLPRVSALAGAQVFESADTVFVMQAASRIKLSFRTFVDVSDVEELVDKTRRLTLPMRLEPTTAFGLPAIRELGERPCDAAERGDGCVSLHVEILCVVNEGNGFLLYSEADARDDASIALDDEIVKATSFGALHKVEPGATMFELFQP